MNTMQLTHEDGIHVLTLTNNANENKLNLTVLHEYLSVIKQVSEYEGSTALLITCEDPKTFSTGIDLEWLPKLSHEDLTTFMNTVEEVCLRLATLKAPTVSCINGNAYAGAALIVAATDFRVMRSDRGRLCFPEVNIGIPFTEIMIETVRLLPATPHVLDEMVLTGRALTGAECLESGIVSELHAQDELQAAAKAFTKNIAAKDRTTYSIIKKHWRKTIEDLKEKNYPDK